MHFKVEDSLFDIEPNAKIGGLFIFGTDNTKNSENIQRILNNYCESIKNESVRMNSKRVLGWNNLLNKLGINSEEHMPASNALLKRATAKGELPNINSLVNAYNFVSLKNSLPIGGHDIDKISDISVGRTIGNEEFVAMNSDKVEIVNADEFAYVDRANNKILTRHLVWRQGETSKITEQTKNIFIPIDDIPNLISRELLEQIAIELATIIVTEFGGKAFFGIADRFNPTLESEKLTEIKLNPDLPKLLLNKRMDVVSDEKLVEEVLTKGVKDIFPGKDELKKLMLSGKRIRLYTGIDPTASFIHMGHMVWMKKLSQFQKLGHEVVFLIGGFTAMIGDFDKIQGREQLTKEQVQSNFRSYQSDAAKILDFEMTTNPVRVVNNYDWLSALTLEDWLQVMSNATMQHLLSHETFKERIKNEMPIRLHEIMYPLMQGYDSVALETDLEVGGSDQTFNMLTGRILERNMLGKEKHVLTMKLLVDGQGNKMGKTTGNAVSFKDSPENAYGKVMSWADETMPLAYELLSDKSLPEIADALSTLESDPMQVKKNLAFEITEMMYSKEEAQKAAKQFESVVQNQEIPENIDEIKIKDSSEISIVEFLDNEKLVNSRGEAKRLIEQKGIKINGEVIDSINLKISELELPSIVQIGKRKWIKLV